MRREKIDILLNKALIELYAKDFLLIDPNYDINERSVSHKLASYIDDSLKAEFQNLDVDVEYNRMSIAYGENGIDVGNVVAKAIRYEEHPQKESYVYPDIIIHKRNQSENVVIIEIKMSWKNNRKKLDYEKINQYLEQLNYQYGIFIELHPTLEKTTLEYGPFTT